jgi:hypothetical protein
MTKNIDYIDGHEDEEVKPWADGSILSVKNWFFLTTIDTIGQTSKIFNLRIDAINVKHDM